MLMGPHEVARAPVVPLTSSNEATQKSYYSEEIFDGHMNSFENNLTRKPPKKQRTRVFEHRLLIYQR